MSLLNITHNTYIYIYVYREREIPQMANYGKVMSNKLLKFEMNVTFTSKLKGNNETQIEKMLCVATVA